MIGLELYRVTRGLSQEQVARTLGVSQSVLSKIERGMFKPRRVVLLHIARYFEVPPEHAHVLLARVPEEVFSVGRCFDCTGEEHDSGEADA